MPCLSFCLGAFFSPVGLLFLGFSFLYLLVNRSEVSWPLVDLLFGFGLRIFVFFLFCFSLCYSTSLLSAFSGLPLCPFLVSVLSLCVSSLASSSAFGSFTLARGFAVSLLLSSGCVYCFVP